MSYKRQLQHMQFRLKQRMGIALTRPLLHKILWECENDPCPFHDRNDNIALIVIEEENKAFFIVYDPKNHIPRTCLPIEYRQDWVERLPLKQRKKCKKMIENC